MNGDSGEEEEVVPSPNVISPMAEPLECNLGYMPTDYDYDNLRYLGVLHGVGRKCREKEPKQRRRRARMRLSDQRQQISDDEDDEDACPAAAAGICPSCRLAVNKDTGRLKWCMGGNDIWRTRIRFMLLFPAVILPVAIIIIALSKSTVVGKLRDDRAHSSAAADDAFIPTVQNDIEHSELNARVIHPDVETSFLPPESSVLGLRSLERRKRDIQQKRASTTTTSKDEAQQREQPSSARRHSSAMKSDGEPLRELQVNFSR